MSAAAVVLAAGRGERLGRRLPKAFVPLAGVPILVHTLERLGRVPELRFVLPVLPPGELPRYRALGPALARVPGLLEPVEGGALRQDSAAAGLAALPPEVDLVAVHDAARPLVPPEAVSRVIRAAREHGAAILARPLPDTVKRVRGGVAVETLDRAELFAAQTPQVFERALYREALERARRDGFRGTDDASLVERLGRAVRVVPGDRANRKITEEADLAFAEFLLRRQHR